MAASLLRIADWNKHQKLAAFSLGSHVENPQNRSSLRSSSGTKLLAYSMLLIPDDTFAVQVTDAIEVQPIAIIIAIYAGNLIPNISKHGRVYTVFSMI